jgi:hypothetical protein
VFEEAGVVVYDAETCRTRHLADLDRGAGTGHVPTALLSRWERALEDVSAWRFAPTPVHGDLTGGRFLVTFSDEENPETASVRAVTGWEHAKIADPAEDFAALFSECTLEAFESIVEAYSVTRIERPDRHLRHRAKVVSELRLLTQLLDAVHAAEPVLITRRAAELRALEERVAEAADLVVTEPEPSTAAVAGTSPASAPADQPVDATFVTSSKPADDATQVLKTGPAADPTAVIPPDELDRLRRNSDDSPPGQPPAEPDSDWYEVLTPSPSPVADSTDHSTGEAEVIVGSGADADEEAEATAAKAAEPDDAEVISQPERDAAAADATEEAREPHGDPAAGEGTNEPSEYEGDAPAADAPEEASEPEGDAATAEGTDEAREPDDGSGEAGEAGDTAGSEADNTRPLVRSRPSHAPGARPARAARPPANRRRR